MNPARTLPALPQADETGGVARQLASLGLSLAFTFGLLAAIAYHNRAANDAPPEIPAVESIALAEPPPPPLPKAEAAPDAAPPLDFTVERSSSPLKITVSPPSPAKILPEDLSKVPPPQAHVAPLTGKFHAKTGLVTDPRRVYQKQEVDQIPLVLSRGDMNVPQYIRGDARTLNVLLLVIVNADGSIGPVSLARTSENQKFDELMLEKIHHWTFSPAVKGGRKVRCLIGQPVIIKWTADSSPFR